MDITNGCLIPVVKEYHRVTLKEDGIVFSLWILWNYYD